MTAFFRSRVVAECARIVCGQPYSSVLIFGYIRNEMLSYLVLFDEFVRFLIVNESIARCADPNFTGFILIQGKHIVVVEHGCTRSKFRWKKTELPPPLSQETEALWDSTSLLSDMNTFVPDWYMKWGTSRSVNGYAYNSLNVWHHEDIFDPTSPWVEGDFPALRESNPSTRDENDFYTKEVNYVRLRNLLVGYTFPQKWIKKAGIQKARVYFQGSNLFCWDNLGDYGIDPETSTVNGTDYPQTRVLSFGLNLTF